MTTDTDVRELLSRWAEAEQAGDPAALGPMLTDDFVGIGPLGFALSKPAWVGRHASGDLHYERFTVDDAGTDFDRIERTCAYAFAPDDGGPASAALIEQLRGLAAAGIQTVIGRVDGDDPRPGIENLGRHIVPAVADAEVTS